MDRLRRTISVFVLALALLPLTATALPADKIDTPEESAAKVEVFRLLNSDSIEKQEKAIRLIGHYAHTDQFDADFYRLMVTPLQYIVAKGQTEPLRIMAVSALYSIGSDPAMKGLQAQVNGLDSDRVTEVTENALAQYKADRTENQ